MFTPGFVRRIRSTVVGWLLVALPLHGFSATVVQLLGTSHSHRSSVSTASPMEGWIDNRRGTSPSPTAAARRHGHAHVLLQRHHHEQGDDSVASLDGDKRDVAGDGGSSSGSATQAMAFGSTSRVEPPAEREFGWRRMRTERVPCATGDRLERPPKVS